MPALLVSGITFLACFAVFESVPERPEGPSERPLVVIVPALGALALSFLLTLSVALFNRPRFLVSRDLRGEPGVIGELLVRRRVRAPGGDRS